MSQLKQKTPMEEGAPFSRAIVVKLLPQLSIF